MKYLSKWKKAKKQESTSKTRDLTASNTTEHERKATTATAKIEYLMMMMMQPFDRTSSTMTPE